MDGPITRTSGNWPYALLAIVLALIIYYPSLGGAWLNDDSLGVYNNPLVTSPDLLDRIWFSFDDHDYWPLTRTAFWVQYRFFGDYAPAYRIFNLMLHVGVCIMLMILGNKMGIAGARWGALIFLVHPAAVPTVAWISELKNLLMVAFLIPTAYCFHKYSRSGNRISFALSVLFYVLAMFAKTSGVFFPFILIILQWRNHGKLTVKNLIPVIPFFLVSGVMGLLTMYAQYRLDIIDDNIVSGSMRIALCGWTFLFYLYKSILPVNLTIQYASWKESLEHLGLLVYLPVSLLLSLVFTTLLKWRKKWASGVIYLIFPFGILLIPVLGLFTMSSMQHSQVAAFYIYPALWPMCMVVGAWIHSNVAGQSVLRSRMAVTGASLCIVTCAVATISLSRTYQNGLFLWEDAVLKSPNSEVAHKFFADELSNIAYNRHQLVQNLDSLNRSPLYSGKDKGTATSQQEYADRISQQDKNFYELTKKTLRNVH